jgi:hypothetical protein
MPASRAPSMTSPAAGAPCSSWAQVGHVQQLSLPDMGGAAAVHVQIARAHLAGSEDAHAQRRGWPVDRALHRKVGLRLGRQHPGGYRWRAAELLDTCRAECRCGCALPTEAFGHGQRRRRHRFRLEHLRIEPWSLDIRTVLSVSEVEDDPRSPSGERRIAARPRDRDRCERSVDRWPASRRCSGRADATACAG